MNDKIRETYDVFYEKNEWKNIPRITKFKIQTLLKILKTINKNYPKTVLDVGCGTGLYSHIFRNLGFQVFGFDFSKKAIEQARKKYDIDFRILDGYALDYSVKFDLIFAKGFSPFNTDNFTKTNQLVDYWSKYLNNNGTILIIT